MAEPSSSLSSSKDELIQLIKRLGTFLALKMSNLFSISLQKLDPRSVGAIAGLAVAIIFTYRLMRSPATPPRRQPKRQAPTTSTSATSAQSSSTLMPSGVCSSSEDSRAQNVVDEFFQPVKPTLGQIVRQKLSEGRKVTCRLLGVILEESSPEELQIKATVKSSVLDVLLEITKFCDLYLMERVIDDESEKNVLLALENAGIFTSGGLVKDKVLFCSTENGRTSFVRQLEPDWHIDTNPEIVSQLAEYFEQLISKRQCHGITVKQNGEFGKGVFAETDFEEEQLILKDQMLLGAQHSSNKIDCLVCSYCFQFIGSIEQQIGRKLYLKRLGVSPHSGCQNDSSDEDEDEDEHFVQNHHNSENGASSSSIGTVPLPKMAVESLMNGEMSLPYSEKFPLPSVVSCPGRCEEPFYCSKSCAEADWESFHSLLCPGEKTKSQSREALLKFIQHANETNDIFLLAAKAISFTILRYRKLKASLVTEHEKSTVPSTLGTSNLSLLLDAWKPISIGHKRRWWDCVSLPDDIDASDEAAFRMQMRELAFTSLQLLKEAIFDKECEPLFSLEIYGHIIGMFELNNLDLVVASPVEDYFIYIDDLPNPQKKEAENITRPYLDALGEDYSVCCEGTAFYPLQSCMNHSCCPNAKAFKREEDRDGQATIIAVRPVCKREEINISYIDEDLPFEERQALLADYGFRCRCPRCLEEEP
ncbi:hypothetical protein CCACVL1_24353 [Corchorus capsularis]|uniref:SET domain-containing protein n=1 Tax=Corchorus capsularis TaxID=210143 RepID=A0A1R3GQ23_COCAP|nr:hypothetical protein CCACVL1_24353 [Corchorus capsularis]